MHLVQQLISEFEDMKIFEDGKVSRFNFELKIEKAQIILEICLKNWNLFGLSFYFRTETFFLEGLDGLGSIEDVWGNLYNCFLRGNRMGIRDVLGSYIMVRCIPTDLFRWKERLIVIFKNIGRCSVSSGFQNIYVIFLFVELSRRRRTQTYILAP